MTNPPKQSFVQDSMVRRMFCDILGAPILRHDSRILIKPELPEPEERAMTEAEWLASEDLAVMLEWIRLGKVAAEDDYPPNYSHCAVRVSDRKLRLFACACARQVWGRLEYLIRVAFEEVELCVDGLKPMPPSPIHADLQARGTVILSAGLGMSPASQVALLRDIVGNPFRTPPFGWKTVRAASDMSAAALESGASEENVWWGEHCPWLTPTVVSLAEAAYRERPGRKCEACSGYGASWGSEGQCAICHGTGRIDDGSLDPDRLAVLADALSDAGCTDEDILGHLRGQERVVGRYEVVEAKDNGAVVGHQVRWSIPDEQGRYRWVGHYYAGAEDDPSPRWCQHAAERDAAQRNANSPAVAAWRPLRGPHVRGCWVMDLILGKS